MLYAAPNPQMKRYVQTAVGFVMIIVVMNPVTTLINGGDVMTFDMLSKSLGTEIEEGDDALYVAAMEDIVEKFVYDEYGITAEVDISLEAELTISGMSVTLRAADRSGIMEPGPELSRLIRSDLSEEYGIEERLIIIM